MFIVLCFISSSFIIYTYTIYFVEQLSIRGKVEVYHNGEWGSYIQYVVMIGISVMQKLCVVNWALVKQLLSEVKHILLYDTKFTKIGLHF